MKTKRCPHMFIKKLSTVRLRINNILKWVNISTACFFCCLSKLSAHKVTVWQKNRLFTYLFIYLFMTWISTVTQMANWWSLQLVDKEPTTITHTDESMPAAAITMPVKAGKDGANFTRRRMASCKPTWCMGCTAVSWNTGGRHLASWSPCKSVPSRLCSQSGIASVKSSAVSLCSREVVEHLVLCTF